MFFEPRRRTLELTPHSVLALRPSLNTPVVAASDLPVGPACAAILVHTEPRHGLQISVGVRSLGCGSVTVYGFPGPIAASVVNVALDAALSFAESMGFLFDDDLVDDDIGSQEKAVLRWQEMIGDALGGSPADRSESETVELFDADGGELTDPPEPAPLAPAAKLLECPPAQPERRLAPALAQAAELTKFRVDSNWAVESAPAPNEAAAQGAAQGAAQEAAQRAAQEASRRALGRMRLVKRPGKQAVQDVRRAWLLKLLTSF